MSRWILLCSVTFVLAACSLGGSPVPADHFYRLPEITMERQLKPLIDMIVIKPVKASGLYHERAMLYVDKSRPLEIQRYHYNFWSKPPADLIHDAIYQGLTSSGVAVNVQREQTDHRPDYIIDSRIVRFERVVEGEAVTIQLALEISLQRVSSPQRLIRLYQSSVRLETSDIHASVEAYGKALRAIVKQLLDDVLSKK